jgi:hypothetical protein
MIFDSILNRAPVPPCGGILSFYPSCLAWEARLRMHRVYASVLEVPDNAGADKKIALATIARRYIQLRQSRPEVPSFPA